MNKGWIGRLSAYPHPGEPIDADYYVNSGYSGMSIRQRYAMAAMQGFITAGWVSGSHLAEAAFKQADEMIAFEEREHEEKVKALRDKETQESKGV